MSALHSPAKIQAPSPPLWVSFADGPCPAQNSHEARRPGCPQTQGSGSPLLFLQRMFHSVKGRLEIVCFLLSTLRYLWASGSCLGVSPLCPALTAAEGQVEACSGAPAFLAQMTRRPPHASSARCSVSSVSGVSRRNPACFCPVALASTPTSCSSPTSISNLIFEMTPHLNQLAF